ncbi:Major facilitator super domain-containing protein 12 [Desmophyllum pertusum]|uniref:Major facilitator super domain-containing protein 12 n=1 Tax=Desmophyllum pertusum TaxID=174260 RepID=A0A9W9YVK2_9CNID|nr:Major facilitator super domain-containing protein 12 [Desmophyllum pertusum]
MGVSRLFCNFFTKGKASKKDRLHSSQRFCYSVGHVLNDLAGNAWFSYLLVFLTKVAGLTNANAGYVLLISQVFEGACTPVAGILCDKTVCKYGRRKSWHLLGTACVTISFPFIFNQCLGCTDSSNTVKFFYYTGFSMVFGFGWGSTQIGHLSLIPEISKRESERVELSALRSALTFSMRDICLWVTWILLGQSNEETLSPNVWRQFMYLGFIVVGTGTVFNIIFHVGTKEPPSEALLEWQQERKQKKHGKRTCERKALLKVDCDPSPSGKRSSSQRVTTSVCDKSKTPSSCSDELTTSSIESTLEKKEIEDVAKEAIIDRSEPNGSQRTWKDWLKDPAFYKTGLIYTCSRLVVNVSQSYLPLYLTETLKFEKEAIAYFPLVVLISGVFASGTVKTLNKRLGSKITFSLGSELIGHDKKSGAFVYGTISFTDKLSSGVIIAIIQEMNPRTNMTTDCPSCDEFVRNVQSLAPGMAALVALVSVLVFFDSIFVCRRKVDKADMAVQTNFDEALEQKDSCDIAESCEGVNENDSEKSLDCDVEKNSFKERNVGGIPRTMDNYAACRLATPFMPSPLLERRTIL